MATTVTGTLRDTQQNVLANAIATATYLEPLAGYNGGATVQNIRTFTSNGSGVLSMPNLTPGRYQLSVFIPVNDSTTLTMVKSGPMTVLDQDTQTLESALDTNALPVNQTILQQALAAASAAADSAAAAAASAELADSEGNATAAQEARLGAEDAEGGAVAAAASIGMYADTTLAAALVTGLAAAAEGETFHATGGDVDYIGVYKDLSGVATEQARYIKSSYVTDRLGATADPDVAYDFEDNDGRVAMRITGAGRTKVAIAEIREADIGDMVVADGAWPDALETLEDEGGKVAARVAPETGQHDLTHLTAETIAADTAFIGRTFQSVADIAPGNFYAEIVHLVYYGQSWSLGFDAAFPPNMAQAHDTIMFNGGVRQMQSVATNPLALQSFVPAVEAQGTGTPENPSALVGETGAVAMAAQIKEMIRVENNLDYTGHDYQLLVSAPGEGGKSIEDLANNSLAYMQRLKEQIDRGYALSQAAGKSYCVGAVAWLQGYAAGDPSTYAAQMEAMRLDIDTYAKSVTGQGNTVKLITWQKQPENNTPTSQWSAGGVFSRYVQAAEDYEHIICTGASYHLHQIGPSNVHLRAEEQANMGKAFGVAFKRSVIDGVKYQPLKPVTLRRSGTIAMLKTNLTRGTLVRDIVRVASATNDGFNLYDSAGTPLTISSVSIVGPDTIKIVAASSIPSGAILRYADTGTNYAYSTKWRGNIRDNGSSYAPDIDRWLVAFSRTFDN